MDRSRQFFLLGCMFEGGLFFLGVLLCGAFGRGFLADCHWDPRDALAGLLAALPALGLFIVSFHSPWGPLRQIRLFLQEMVLPYFEGWRWHHLLALSLLAGLGEEFLFRGAIQGGLSILVGQLPALILASLIFGLVHPMTWGYLILTAVMGFYLGGIWLGTGNLLAPILAHALYDFLALSYLLRKRRD